MNKKVAVALFSLLLCFGTALIGDVRSSESYSTTFPLTQNPINEASHWVNGKSTGIEWANVSTTPGKAIGHEGTVLYSDATALLQNGLSWEPDQTVQATVFQLPGTVQPNCYQEVELRLRSHISPYSITGYEINYKVSNESYAYFGVVRWNGALGNFTPLFSKHGSQYGVQNGDVIMAKIIGPTIYVYKNNMLLGSGVDYTYNSGAPGVGFNLNGANTQSNGQSCLLTNANYGLTTFSAVSSKTWF